MSSPDPVLDGGRSTGPPGDSAASPGDDEQHRAAQTEDQYEPGDTLHRGMAIACGLVLLFFALLSCGFIASVLSQRH